MPILTNPKQEAFAQGLAQGLAKVEAYRQAGYKKPSDPVASRLSRDVKVAARLKELQAKTVAKFEVTAEMMALQFIEDRSNAIRWGQGSAAHAASVSLAKLFGLMVERVSVSHNYSLMSEQELRLELASLVAEARSLRPGVSH
jgi:hypothetical protein